VRLRSNTDVYVAPLRFAPFWDVGDVGKLEYDLRVLQVIGPTEALVGPTSILENIDTELIFYIKDVKTDGWVDGHDTKCSTLLEVYGTYQYRSPTGSKRTVRAVRPAG
jgi:hypothetical protein